MTIKKWTYAVGLAAGFALVACTGENGQDGAPGADGTSCIAKALKDSSGFDIICGDESIGTIKNGEDGEDGKKGDKGDKGEKGDKGAKGDKGDAGEDGASCTVKPMEPSGFKVICDGDSVGVLVNGVNGDAGADGKSAYELAVAAGFEGDSAAWLAALKGDQGVKGDTGVAGADGKSAYELAVEAGFEGDSAAWIASLKGAKGDKGDKGDTGDKGDKGDTGDAGESCELEDNGDGTVTVTCNGASATLFKATCGTVGYDPVTQFCYNSVQGIVGQRCKNWPTYPDVDRSGYSYNPTVSFCDATDTLRTLCSVKQEDGTFKSLPYDTETQYCEDNQILAYAPCVEGSSVKYKPTSEYCYTTKDDAEFKVQAMPTCGTNNRPYDPVRKFCKETTSTNGTLKPRDICGDEAAQKDTFNIDIRYNTELDADGLGEICDERDYQIYKIVKSGDKTWMAQNLNYDYQKPTATLATSSFCYDDNPDNCAKYGRLYLWSAAIDSTTLAADAENPKTCGNGVSPTACGLEGDVQGVCPDGWHLPNSDDLSSYPAGFNALKAGYFKESETSVTYIALTTYAGMWSSTDSDASNAYRLMMPTSVGVNLKSWGNPVRCIKD